MFNSPKTILMKNTFLLVLLFISAGAFAQENLSYQKPSKEIMELADVPLAPVSYTHLTLPTTPYV